MWTSASAESAVGRTIGSSAGSSARAATASASAPARSPIQALAEARGPSAVRVEEHRACAPAVLDAGGPDLDRPAQPAGERDRDRGGRERDRRRGSREGGMLGADLDQQLAIPPAPPRRALRPRPQVRAGGGGEHERDQRQQAALRRRLATAHLLLERQQPPEGLARPEARRPCGSRQPGTRAPGAAPGRGRRPRPARPRRRRPRPAARPPGNAPSRGRAPPARARPACSRARCASSMLPTASGRRAADSAAPSSSSSDRRSDAGASSSSARRRKRTACSGDPRSLARRADARERVERPALTDGPGGAGGQQVGGHALEPRRVARQLARGGQMQLRPLGRRDRVLQRLLDDRVHEPRRQSWSRSSASINASTASAGRLAVDPRDARRVRQRGIVAEDRRAPGRPRATAGGCRRSRASTNRATDGGPMAAIASASRPRRPPPRSSRAVMSWRASKGFPPVVRAHSKQTSSPVSSPRLSRTSSAIAAVAERLRAQSRQRLALDQSGQGLRRGRGLARSHREDHAGGDLLDPRLQVGEEAKRVLVGPVRVVDKQGERPLLGEPRAEPMQAVESREQAIVGGGPVGHLLEQRARQSRGACEGAVTTAVRERLDARRQQLDHDTEGKLPLQRSAARAQERPSRRRLPTPRPLRAASSCRSPAAPSTITTAPEPAAAPWSARPMSSNSDSRSNSSARLPGLIDRVRAADRLDMPRSLARLGWSQA